MIKSPSSTAVITERYRVRLAASAADLRAAQRLRFHVFNLELHEGLVDSHLTGLDCDPFDAVCAHLVVEERETNTVVGTYRLQTGASAKDHLGYYSEQEFDFSPFEGERQRILELGRACVAAEHRNQLVLGLLWRGILNYARDRGLRFLLGCSSLSSQDEAGAIVTYQGLAARFLVAERWRTLPVHACRCQRGPAEPLAVPRLMVAYLSAGSRICGEPAIDREFGTIDFLTLMDLESVSPRFARKYLA
ncbi:GNAT family N-acetyltransferase [Synoicihabitans lomoniglobus]|uniref:GNAT family N-acetyltransferase n=1 Tax=Synoicihabitans lomoniglobus TaxID=2909285 RepID=A0AAE9ZYE3_9BACT|nr:GNAT family N-acetyltransferase [Opitutaceae bacterium LMO-M01]WED63478.1 GNAT family N-acetyltransferase [Opitutaceae bacterium LMO-M01]